MRFMYLLPFVPAWHSLVRLLALGLYKTPPVSASNKAVAVNTCVVGLGYMQHLLPFRI